jgi:hypothetical protein
MRWTMIADGCVSPSDAGKGDVGGAGHQWDVPHLPDDAVKANYHCEIHHCEIQRPRRRPVR